MHSLQHRVAIPRTPAPAVAHAPAVVFAPGRQLSRNPSWCVPRQLPVPTAQPRSVARSSSTGNLKRSECPVKECPELRACAIARARGNELEWPTQPQLRRGDSSLMQPSLRHEHTPHCKEQAEERSAQAVFGCAPNRRPPLPGAVSNECLDTPKGQLRCEYVKDKQQCSHDGTADVTQTTTVCELAAKKASLKCLSSELEALSNEWRKMGEMCRTQAVQRSSSLPSCTFSREDLSSMLAAIEDRCAQERAQVAAMSDMTAKLGALEFDAVAKERSRRLTQVSMRSTASPESAQSPMSSMCSSPSSFFSTLAATTPRSCRLMTPRAL